MKKQVILVLTTLCFYHTGYTQEPIFEWAKQMGGADTDAGYSIVVDTSGNVYTIGCFRNTVDFDPGPKTYYLTSVEYDDVFIQKLDANGDFIWAKQIGGKGNQWGYSIALDAMGNVYSSGWFSETVDFDPGTSNYNLASIGGLDIYVQKLDPSGNFIWVKQMGGKSSGRGYCIAVDDSGNVYTSGYFYDTIDFNPDSGTYNLTSAGGSDIFVQKLDASGNFVWTKQMGGTGQEFGYSINVDASGNVYTTGIFEGTADFDPGIKSYNLTSNGDFDIFIQKLNSSGNFVWAKKIGGKDIDLGLSIAVDNSGNVFTTGYFTDTVDLNPGSETCIFTSDGSKDVFVQKLDSLGNFLWAKQMGGSTTDKGHSIALNASGEVFITGFFGRTADFDPGPNTHNLISVGAYDIFVLKLNASGNFVWVEQMGGTGHDYGNSINVDASGNIYTTGIFNDSADFDPGTGICNLSSVGSWDIFVQKMSQNLVGTHEQSFPNEIIVYPNPTESNFTIDLGNIYERIIITVTDITGKLIQIQEIKQKQLLNLSMDETKGIYLVKIESQDKQVVLKLMIK